MLVLTEDLTQITTSAGPDNSRTHFSTGDNPQAQLLGREPIQDKGTTNLATPLFFETKEVGRPTYPAPTRELEPQRRVHCGKD